MSREQDRNKLRRKPFLKVSGNIRTYANESTISAGLTLGERRPSASKEMEESLYLVGRRNHSMSLQPTISSQPLYVTSAYHVGLVPCRLSQPPIKSLQPTISSQPLYVTSAYHVVGTNTKEAIEIRC
ncbi:hypothetical protein RCL_jg15967.t1 [Rhizophagus clarus]|uniref:Uncharacterized protein n=1 Tax=Rhizophagus clarus TaxID=94130 RepID=A0A8H3QL92_9GLOM|nr:hypothetical protein RCL_jg15967.t1 [Rhizophagus clarus]